MKHVKANFLLSANAQLAIFGVCSDGKDDLAGKGQPETLVFKGGLCPAGGAGEAVGDRPWHLGLQFQQLVERQRIRLGSRLYQEGDALNWRGCRLDLADGFGKAPERTLGVFKATLVTLRRGENHTCSPGLLYRGGGKQVVAGGAV